VWVNVALVNEYSAGDVGVTELDAELSAPYPVLFVAATVNVYVVPAVNPVMVIGLLTPVAVNPPGELVTL
jgi:hypothetical protein